MKTKKCLHKNQRGGQDVDDPPVCEDCGWSPALEIPSKEFKKTVLEKMAEKAIEQNV